MASSAAEIADKVRRANTVGSVKLTPLSVAGTIDDGADGLEGVAVVASVNSVDIASTVTDADGDYSFAAGFPPNSSVTITATLTGYSGDPLVQALAVANVTDADITLTED